MNTRRLFSWLLIAGGSCLLFLGARDWVTARFGQVDAERDFEQTLPEPAVKRRVPDSIAGMRRGGSAEAPAGRVQPRPGASIAKLSIPRLSTELYVVEGLGAKELRRGPGHMEGTALPGENGNCIIAGHRDTHFRVLQEVRKGDDILVETPSGSFLYRVQQAVVVSPNHTAPLRDTPDARLNLITCYPFHYVGSAPKRYVVEAKLAAVLPAAHRRAAPNSSATSGT